MLPKFLKKNKKKSSFDKNLLKEYFKNQGGSVKNSFCKAPFVSMDFATNGMVIPCCLNHAYIYGKYPENSLHDIWFGEKVKLFRKKLLDMDLSQGCFLCEQDLLNKNFDLIYSKTYSYFPTNLNSKYPLNMGFALDNTCNLRCQMCSGENSSTYRSEIEHRPPFINPYDSNFVLQLEEFIPYLQRVVFAGGEPFLINIYYEIWERIIAINPKIEVVICTNGTVLNSRIKNLIDKGVFYFAISMDSLNKVNFEKIREKANFEQFMDNLDYFYKYSKQNNRWMTLNVCPIQQNWREIPELVRKANEMQISIFLNNVYFPPHCTLRSLNSVELEEIISYYNEQILSLEANNENSGQNIKLFTNFINSLKIWKEEAVNRANEEVIEDLIQNKYLFFKYISNIINEKKHLSELEKKEKIIKHINTCEEIFQYFEGKEDILAKSLLNLKTMPKDVLYAELEFSSLEVLISRFMQAGI